MTNPGEFADCIELFLDNTPHGPVQDADCLDLCGYLLAECGRIDAALLTYERCLISPSTSREHVLELAVRYLALAASNGATARAIERVSAVLDDLMRFGDSSREIQQHFFKPASDKLPAAIIDDLRGAIAKERAQPEESVSKWGIKYRNLRFRK